jgi:hypothetical protein
MTGVYLKLKSDVQYYEALYDVYKNNPKFAKSKELAKTMREVIAALKKLERMH